MMRETLTPAEHVQLGKLLRQARRDLLTAGAMSKVYGKHYSQMLFDAANSLTVPRSFLEKKLFDEVGGETVTVGDRLARDVYFGIEPELTAAEE
jgi:hypothetical protein